MPIYTVTCRGKLTRGVVTQLSNAGVYLQEEAELGYEGDGMQRHLLKIEASSADDAILVAKGRMAVAGGAARDYTATEGAEPE
jgi:hypothetical protein